VHRQVFFLRYGAKNKTLAIQPLGLLAKQLLGKPLVDVFVWVHHPIRAGAGLEFTPFAPV